MYIKEKSNIKDKITYNKTTVQGEKEKENLLMW